MHQDTIFIQELKTTTTIGIQEWEKHVKQRVILDLTLTTDISAAAKGDDIKQTVNYRVVSEAVISLVETSNFELIETLAVAVADFILQEFKVPTVKVTVYKPDAIPQAKTVGISIERTKLSSTST